ncbi:hypothetical protein ACOMHN_001998 [Nucella lapillus]
MAYATPICLLLLFTVQAVSTARPPSPAQPEKVKMCYFANWAQHKAGEDRFTPEKIDASLCTHILYAFAHINADGTDLETTHPTDTEFYTKIINLKNKHPGLKVLLSVGGAGLEQTERFNMVASSVELTTRFVENAVAFLNRYGFDGLDLSWQFPQSSVIFKDLIGALRSGFNKEAQDTGKTRRLLTVAVWGNHEVAATFYDPSRVAQFLDYFLLMTYDQWGIGMKKLGHHAALRVRPQDAQDSQLSRFSVEKTVETWLQQGVKREAIVIGLATFGKSTRLFSPQNANLGDSHRRVTGTPGKYTASGAVLAYYEICTNVLNDTTNGWTSVYVPVTEGSIAYSLVEPYDWVCYDDPRSFRAKAQYALDENLAGVFFWSMDYDDYLDTCKNGRYPLLSEVSAVFATQATPTTPTPGVTNPTTTQASQTTLSSIGTTATSTHTYTSKPTPSYKKECVEFECPDQNHWDESNPAFLYPDPYSCTQFYQCAGMVAYQMACPASLVFSPETLRCEYADDVDCVPCPSKFK